MGDVYRARDSELNRKVAIKILPNEFSNDQERVARFHREAQSIAALNHWNIAATKSSATLGTDVVPRRGWSSKPYLANHG
jgi:serine/threonine protein kinase